MLYDSPLSQLPLLILLRVSTYLSLLLIPVLRLTSCVHVSFSLPTTCPLSLRHGERDASRNWAKIKLWRVYGTGREREIRRKRRLGCKGNEDGGGVEGGKRSSRNSCSVSRPKARSPVAADAAVAGAPRGVLSTYLDTIQAATFSTRYNPIADGIRRVRLFNETVLR